MMLGFALSIYAGEGKQGAMCREIAILSIKLTGRTDFIPNLALQLRVEMSQPEMCFSAHLESAHCSSLHFA
eukprot:scaffold449080_cov25-Prasinocladus_malaysianus.AAC.1